MSTSEGEAVNKKIVAIVLIVFLALVAGGAWGISVAFAPKPVEQPIAFNHKLHLEEDMACLDCHRYADKTIRSTFPVVAQCMLCHEEPQGESAEEAKVREYGEAGKQIPWKQVNRLVGHVYFSHIAHVKYAKMECAECHGDMKERTAPVSVTQIGHLTMKKCMQCHAEKGVQTDCLTCHK